MKIYIANRQISIGITMGDKQKSIDFVAMSGSGSTFKTNNKAEQAAIEAHPEYGKMFKLYLSDEPEEEVKSEKVKVKATEEQAAEGDGSPAETSQDKILEVETAEEQDAAETQEKEFECFEDAREWVSENLGVPKKKLMSKTAVIRYGNEAGIVITIKD